MKRKTAKKGAKKSKRVGILRVFVALGVLIIVSGVGWRLLASDSTLPCANSISCIDDLSGKITDEIEGVFAGKKVTVPEVSLAKDYSQPPTILGENTQDNKHIYVDLTNQKIMAFEGSNLVLEFPVSTGKWYPTPTGDFRIWVKLRATKMEGGSKALNTYYYLPNVQYTMYFHNDKISKSRGFALHGAYWHNNFGHPMSHGCVNISNENAEKLYVWASPPSSAYTTYATEENPGTQVTIYGQTPAE